MKKILLLLLLIPFLAKAQQLDANWKEKLQRNLKQFQACEQKDAGGINPCNNYIGKALQTVYTVNDFYAAELNRHMLVGEIAAYLKESKDWQLLGFGYEKQALQEAQTYANHKKAAVAVYLNEEGIGLVSLILPGEMTPSGTWGCQVPNSAAFIVAAPEKSYVGKGLSYSFDRRVLKDVLLFGRN